MELALLGQNNIAKVAKRELGQFALFIFLVALVRLSFLAFSPLELSPDEAYYWDWSRRLAWGYYSKPPMVAWLIAISTWLLPVSEFAVRLPAALLSIFTTIAIYFTGKKVAGHNAGIIAALSYCGTIGAAVAGFIMTIDAPLLCFWAWTLFFLWLAVDAWYQGKANTSVIFWMMAGVFCGLGLLSKQTMVALSGATAIFLMATSQNRRLLGFKGPYLFYVLQALMLLPFLWWNYNHGWITFVHTAHHFEQSEKTPLFRLDTFFELLGTQAGLVTPLLFIVLLCCSICTVILLIKKRSFSKDDKGSYDLMAPLLFLLSGLLPLVAVFILSLKQRINANWPAPFYISLSILMGLWLGRFFHYEPASICQQCKKAFRPAIAFGLILVTILYALPFIFVHTSLSGSKLDPTVRLRGWKQLAREADVLLSEMAGQGRCFVVARRRQTVSELAFYMAGHPMVYRWNGVKRRVKSQYELWPGPSDKIGWNALVIVDAHKKLDGVDSCFKSFKFLKQIKIRLGEKRTRVFNAYWGYELEKWTHS